MELGKYKHKFIVYLLIICLTFRYSKSFQLKLTKVQCDLLDESVASIDVCRVKAVSRYVQYLSLDIGFRVLPITEYTARYALMKRENGYKPFLYKVYSNCTSSRHPTPVTRIIRSWFTNSTNLLHVRCPITHTHFIIPRLENRKVVGPLEKLPIPHGDYALFSEWTLNNKPAFNIKFFATVF